MKRVFGGRVQKVTIDAGFTCPNRDGTKSTGGCAFCNNNAFNPSYCSPEKPVTQQVREGIEFHEKRYKSVSEYFVYFQAFSNTYGDVHWLKKLYNEALEVDKVIGLIIGTRPDCVNAEIYDLLAEINVNKHVVVEFGVESVYDKTLESINRCHTYGESVEAIKEAAQRGLKTGAHLIFGLPGESRDMIMKSAEVISELPLHSIKFHQLQIVKGTRFEKDYKQNPNQFELFELEEYIDFISEYIGHLNPEFVVERLAGETQPWHNLGVKWNLRYDQVLQLIEKRMEEMDVWQGKFLK